MYYFGKDVKKLNSYQNEFKLRVEAGVYKRWLKFEITMENTFVVSAKSI